MPTTIEILTSASAHLKSLTGHTFDLLDLKKPISPDAAVNLAKVVSKLSPLLGNLIEFNIVEYLEKQKEYAAHGNWIRQDPGFPDTIFQGSITPTPGFEVKAWFPLATEITARFKDSQRHFADDQTYVAMVAWLPEYIIFGKPVILAVGIFSGKSVAEARDLHYHKPPDYLVLEPEDTTARTQNLQQTNTNGYKFQGSTTNASLREKQFLEAQRLVASWGPQGAVYSTDSAYQQRLRDLMGTVAYRLDTNYAKMDRIEHDGIEKFKQQVLATGVQGLTVDQWRRHLAATNSSKLRATLEAKFGIKEELPEDLLS